MRLEHETGLAERNNQLVVGFDQNAVSPLNVTIPADPVAGTPARQVMGGLVYAGVNGAPTNVGSPPAIKVSPRLGMAFSLNPTDGDPRGATGCSGRRGAPACESSAGLLGRRRRCSRTSNRPITTHHQPVPERPGADLGQRQRAAHRREHAASASSIPTAMRRASTRYSVDIQRELPGDMSVGLTYMGATGPAPDLRRPSININQVDPRFLRSTTSAAPTR